jgi:hypothetical protein
VSNCNVPLLPGDRPPADDLTPFRITLRPLPGDIPARIRIRQALRMLLRRFGLKNEGIENLSPPTTHTGEFP